jgi:S1-C subfamily serine protease
MVLVAAVLAAWVLTRPVHNGAGPVMYRSQTGLTDPGSVASSVSAGLVDVNTTLGYQGGAAAGTGIVLTPDGEVLTNNHVVEGATEIEVVDLGNGRTYPATVAGYDRGHDIAVLRLRGASGLTTAKIGDSSTVAVGDSILGIGNAGGQGGAPDVAAGTVTALDQTITATDQDGSGAEQLTGLIQVNANIQAGDSGGPLVNTEGAVIGVDTAASTRYHLGNSARGGSRRTAAEGFAIPINDAVSIARQIASGKSSQTVHIGQSVLLGVSVADQTQGGDSAGGAAVGEVLSGGPAARAGLTAGDVITSVDGHSINSATDLTSVLDQHHPDDNVSVTWLDTAGRQHTATAHLTAGPVG